MPAPKGASVGYVQLLRDNHDFRRLWLGVVTSFFGDWFATIALYTAVQGLTDSAIALALVTIGKTLPIFLMSPIAGPIVDATDRRSLMLATDFGRAFLTLGMLGAYWAESLPALFIMLFLKVTLSGLFIPARTAVVRQLTGPDEFAAAVALNAGTWSITVAIGFAVGGLVTAWLGVEGALIFDIFTYLVSAVFLWGLPSLPAPATEAKVDASFSAGLRYLKEHPRIGAILLGKFGLSFSGGALVTLPIFANGEFEQQGPEWFGMLQASRGLGAFFGSIVFRKITGDGTSTMVRWVPFGLLMGGAGVASMGFADSIWWVALSIGIASVGNGSVWTFSGILAQKHVDASYRGRLFSLEFGGAMLASSASSLAIGTLIDAGVLDARSAAWVGGASLLIPASLYWLAMRGSRFTKP